MSPSTLPTIVIHADWSMHPTRRWMTCARRQPDGAYLACPPQSVPPLDSFPQEVQAQVGNHDCALIGLDFTIGLPVEYARLVGVDHFGRFLQQLGDGREEQ